MGYRARSRSSYVKGHAYIRTGSSVQEDTSLQESYESCEDTTGNRMGDNPFDLTSRTWSEDMVVNGWYNRPLAGQQYIGSLENYKILGPPASVYTLPSPSRSEDQDFSRAFARTNPSRSDFSIPQAVIELKDLPRMVHHSMYLAARVLKPDFSITPATRLEYINDVREKMSKWRLKPDGREVLGSKPSLLNDVAETNLALQFGWAPLMSDMISMLKLGASIEKRQKELERLYQGNGLKRRITLGKTSSTVSDTCQVLSKGLFGTLTLPVRVEKTTERWATVNWKPIDSRRGPYSDDEIWRTLTGITLSSVPSLIWELLPWSWLIDYFANVGDYLSSLQNSIGARAARCCLMTKTSNVMHMPFGQWVYQSGTPPRVVGVVTAGPGTIEYIRKRRAVWSATANPISGSIPFLGERQLSILSSIAVLKRGFYR